MTDQPTQCRHAPGQCGALLPPCENMSLAKSSSTEFPAKVQLQVGRILRWPGIPAGQGSAGMEVFTLSPDSFSHATQNTSPYLGWKRENASQWGFKSTRKIPRALQPLYTSQPLSGYISRALAPECCVQEGSGARGHEAPPH